MTKEIQKCSQTLMSAPVVKIKTADQWRRQLISFGIKADRTSKLQSTK
jgi:hypothetical protein